MSFMNAIPQPRKNWIRFGVMVCLAVALVDPLARSVAWSDEILSDVHLTAELIALDGTRFNGELRSLDSKSVKMMIPGKKGLVRFETKRIHSVVTSTDTFTFDHKKRVFVSGISAWRIAVEAENAILGPVSHKADSNGGLDIIYVLDAKKGLILRSWPMRRQVRHPGWWGSGTIEAVSKDCEIIIDDQRRQLADIKEPVIGYLSWKQFRRADNYYQHDNRLIRINARSSKHDYLDAQYKTPVVVKNVKLDVGIQCQLIGPPEGSPEKFALETIWGLDSRVLNARGFEGANFLNSLDDREVILTSIPLNEREGRTTYKRHASEVLCLKTPTDSYVWNPMAQRFDDEMHRAAIYLGALEADRLALYRDVCRHYDKDWDRIDLKEKIWVDGYVAFLEAERERDKSRMKGLGVLAGLWVAWLAVDYIPSAAIAGGKKADSAPRPSTRTISGIVLNGDGTPAAADTRVKILTDNGSALSQSVGRNSVYTDKLGKFTLPHPSPSNKIVEIWIGDTQYFKTETLDSVRVTITLGKPHLTAPAN
jgi:hypothetical protein